MPEIDELPDGNLGLRFEDGANITGNIIPLDVELPIYFTVTFVSVPTVSRVEMTVTIQRKGGEKTHHAGTCYVNKRGTSVTEVVTVNPDHRTATIIVPPHPHPHRWHGEPGPYDATVALTPVGDDVNEERGPATVIRYDFIGR